MEIQNIKSVIHRVVEEFPFQSFGIIVVEERPFHPKRLVFVKTCYIVDYETFSINLIYLGVGNR